MDAQAQVLAPTAVAILPPKQPKQRQKREPAAIPDALIYEMDEGRPIYYRGYRDVISKTKTLEQVMGCSIIQSLLATLISYFVKENFPRNYVCLGNELGLKLGLHSRRNLDLAVYDKNLLPDRSVLFSNRYAQVPPQIVFEIDTKASLSDFDDPTDYYHRKTEQLLAFGVEKVVWVFTGSRKYLFAEPGQKWSIGNWTDDLELLPGIVLNIEQLLDTV